jgi:tRNA-2-methylthio-N6-dimethylallyladenosine synthase
MKYYIRTFGCQQNEADSERIEKTLIDRGMKKARSITEANYIVINSCMVRHSAESRVYGLVNNLRKIKDQKKRQGNKYKIIVTGCMVGLAVREKSGQFMKRIRKIMPEVDEFMPIEEVGFDHPPVRQDKVHALIPISNGCNNFCTYCVVPFTRGREVSRPYEDIVAEAKKLKQRGYRMVTLLGQNVNSYGADLINKTKHKPVYVKHLGRFRIPTLFPYLLEEVAQMGFEKVDFISSNPWDFSDELIDVIVGNKNITRTIHLPVQSGDNNVLKRMNRWYSRDEYFKLVANLKLKIKNLKLTTDIIAGFPGETDQEFENTVKLCKKVRFEKAYVAMYSPRYNTVSAKTMEDDVPYEVKKKRWQTLEDLIYKPRLGKNK